MLGFLVSTVEDQVPPHLYSFAQHGQVLFSHNMFSTYHFISLFCYKYDFKPRSMVWWRVRLVTGRASILPRFNIKKTFPKIQFFHFVHILVQVLLSVVNKVDVRARHKIHQSIYFNSEVVIVLLTIFLIVIISSSTYIVVI